ncbi:FtsW/RodA/SpoVE family cell cycle protein [Gorillibacterium massiliense]|uniref:FtsW/RodA/SpoVE family cell cycle protein n=1 Tax=Gorillibacterium massiliense TaxID=1280390 RepID=UPI0004B66316|nr:FtsW/RodA/SpoVE family cell cycle protein [Gorillibacterium massiliense]
MDSFMTLTNLKDYECVQRFLREVCRPIRAREMHQQVEWELLSHLDETVAQLQADAGHELPEEEVVLRAVERMGDPAELGKQFHRAHKPRTDWLLLALLALLTVIGSVAMYAVDIAEPRFYGYLLRNDGWFTLVGGALLILLYFTDYRKLHILSWPLFGGAAAFLLYAIALPEKQVYLHWEQLRLFTPEQLIHVSPYLLLAGMIGILHTSKWNRAPIWKMWLLFTALPCLLLLLNLSLIPLLLYAVASSAILIRGSRRNLFPVAGLSILSAVPFLLFVNTAYFQVRFDTYFFRLNSFLHPNRNPDGNFYNQLIQTAIHDSGWLGKGFASSNPNMFASANELILTYLIHSMGWAAGLAICAAILLFLYRLAAISLAIRDPYGKTLARGILLLFIVPTAWNIGMTLGLLPIGGLFLPFIGYGGLHTVAEMSMAGLILGIYRRQPMIPAPQQM